jgi:hypothetical protein
VAGTAEVAGSRWSVMGQKTVVPGAMDSLQPATSHQPPATPIFPATSHQPPATQSPIPSHQPPTTSHLPCTDASPTCLNTLGNLAVQNNREIAVVEQAIALQKKKLWTHWLHADGLNPLAIGLRIVRNIAGGGDRAAAKLELARLTARRAELETTLRQTVLQAVLEYERAQQQLRTAQTSLATHSLQLRFAEISYRLGEGSTEAMLQHWQRHEELQTQVASAALQVKRTFTTLEQLLCAPSRVL